MKNKKWSIGRLFAALFLFAVSFFCMSGAAFAADDNLYVLKMYEFHSASDMTDDDVDAMSFLFRGGHLNFIDEGGEGTMFYTADNRVIFTDVCTDAECSDSEVTMSDSLDEGDNRVFYFSEEDLAWLTGLRSALLDYDGVYVMAFDAEASNEQDTPLDPEVGMPDEWDAPLGSEDSDCESVCILEATLLEKSDDALQNEEPVVDGLGANLNIYLQEVGQYVKYRLVVGNRTDRDYEMQIDGLDDEYVDFDVETSDLNLAAGSKKTVILTVTYKKTIPRDKVDDEWNYLSEFGISLTDGEIVNSPDTGEVIGAAVGAMVVLIPLLIIVLRGGGRKKITSAVMVAIVGCGAIVAGNASATVFYRIIVNTKVEIHPSITFDPNADGVTNLMTNQYFAPGEEVLIKDTTLEREHYRQLEWNTKPDGSGDSLPIYKIYEYDEIEGDRWKHRATLYDNLTLYAIWEHYIYFDMVPLENGGIELTMSYSPIEGSDGRRFRSGRIGLSGANPWASSYPTSLYGGGARDVVKVSVIGEIAPESLAYLFKRFAYDHTSSPTFEIDASNIDAGNATSMSNMFSEAGGLITDSWKVMGLSDFDTSRVTDFSSMFDGAGRNAKQWSVGDLSGWNTSNVTDMSGMFDHAGRNAEQWSVGDLSGWDTSNVTNMSEMFDDAGENAEQWSVGDLSGWDTSNVTDMSEMFTGAAVRSRTCELNLNGWDTSKVTTMKWMFWGACEDAGNFHLDISSFNMSKVTSLENFLSNAGANTTDWKVIIPRTNGNGIPNTNKCIYGKDLSVKFCLGGDKEFTLAP